MAKKITLDELGRMVKKGFDGVDEKFEKIDGRFEKIDGRFEKIDGRFEKIDGRLTKIEANMVNKDYLDEKLADLRGDLVVLTRKEDKKVRKLVDILQKRKVISGQEADEVLAMEPFPELGLHLKTNV